MYLFQSDVSYVWLREEVFFLSVYSEEIWVSDESRMWMYSHLFSFVLSGNWVYWKFLLLSPGQQWCETVFIQVNFFSKYFFPDFTHTCGTDGTSVEVYELPKIPPTHSSKSWWTNAYIITFPENCPLTTASTTSTTLHPGAIFEKHKSLVFIRLPHFYVNQDGVEQAFEQK